MSLSQELMLLVCAHLSQKTLTQLTSTTRWMRKMSTIFFTLLAQHLIKHDTYFAFLSEKQVVRYLQRAHITYYLDEVKVNRQAQFQTIRFSQCSSKVRQEILIQPKELPHVDILKFIGAQHADYHYSDPIVIGLHTLACVDVGAISHVRMVERVRDVYLFLFHDNTIQVHDGAWHMVLGQYRKIVLSWALTIEGDILSVVQPRHNINYPDVKMIDFDIQFDDDDYEYNTDYDIVYIDTDHTAWFSWKRTKLCTGAIKVLCHKSHTFLLTQDAQVRIFYFDRECQSVEEALDFYRCVMIDGNVQITIVTRTQHVSYLFIRSNVFVHGFDRFVRKEDDLSISIFPRLYQELHDETGKYVIEW